MKYLVTGGSGFIGTNLIKRIIQNQNNTVLNMDTKPPKEEDVEWILADVAHSPIDQYFKDVDYVVHLACQPGVEAATKDPLGTFYQNAYGTLRCLEASRKAGVRRFIFASSGGTVLGKQNEPLHEKLAPNPASPYGASKLACEGYCKAYYYTYGLETVILRFSNVYGPHSENKGFNLIPGFIMNVLNEKTCYINGDGSITKDYIYVADLVKAIMLALSVSGIEGEIFQIATGKAESINNVSSIIKKIGSILLGKEMKLEYRDERIGDVSYECNIAKVEAKMLFEPCYDLERGIDLTMRWFRDNWRNES